MKKLTCVIVALALTAFLGRFIEPLTEVFAAEQQIVMVNLVLPIEVQKSVQTGAKFQELTNEAMKYGMGDVILNGRVTYSPQPDNTVRSSVTWDSISMEQGGQKLTEPLGAPLESMVRTPQGSVPRVEVGTSLKAKGDVQTLAEALGRLKKQLDDKNKPITEKNEKVEKTAVAPVVASSQDQPSASSSALPTPFNTTVEAGTTTTSAKCDDRLLDYDKMKAFVQYKPVYTKNGVKTGEGVCSPSYTEGADILKKDGECTYKFDFANSTAIKEEQWYYMSGSTEVLVGGCRDSSTTYPLTESRTGCPVTTDFANMKVFPQSKLVFTVGALETNATMCRPVSSNGITLQEEACNPMFEHDFVNNVSYLVTRMFYLSDVDGSKVYVNQCSRSSAASFPHVTDTASCTPWIMDDEKLLGYQQGQTIIRTGAIAGDVVIRGCETVATVNYSFLGLTTNNKKITTSSSWEIPARTQASSVLIVGQGQPGNITDTVSYWSSGEYGCATTTKGYPGTPGQVQIFDLGNATGQVTVSFNQGSGTYPGDTVFGFGGTNYTAAGGGSSQAGVWSSSTGGNQLVCGYPTTPNPVMSSGYTTLGRFGLANPADYPKGGGCGFGAGGAGALSVPQDTAACPGSPSMPVGSPAPGVVIIEYKIPQYMRPDGTQLN